MLDILGCRLGGVRRWMNRWSSHISKKTLFAYHCLPFNTFLSIWVTWSNRSKHSTTYPIIFHYPFKFLETESYFYLRSHYSVNSEHSSCLKSSSCSQPVLLMDICFSARASWIASVTMRQKEITAQSVIFYKCPFICCFWIDILPITFVVGACVLII